MQKPKANPSSCTPLFPLNLPHLLSSLFALKLLWVLLHHHGNDDDDDEEDNNDDRGPGLWLHLLQFFALFFDLFKKKKFQTIK